MAWERTWHACGSRDERVVPLCTLDVALRWEMARRGRYDPIVAMACVSADPTNSAEVRLAAAAKTAPLFLPPVRAQGDETATLLQTAARSWAEEQGLRLSPSSERLE